jgi:hypothetical protein
LATIQVCPPIDGAIEIDGQKYEVGSDKVLECGGVAPLPFVIR